jgi:hypothetical protein
MERHAMSSKLERNSRVAKSNSAKPMSRSSKLQGLTLKLSAEAKEKLQKLRLKSLDGRGQMPNVSEVIERLINDALKDEPQLPYPNIS